MFPVRASSSVMFGERSLMGKTAAVVRYAGDGFFVGLSPSGHALVLETDGERNGAATPVELLLVAVGSCMASDIVEILHKKRERLVAYRVEVHGQRRTEPPRSFEEIRLHHVIVGSSISEAAVRQAIDLSNTKYCSVAAALRPTAEITVTYELVESEEPTAGESTMEGEKT